MSQEDFICALSGLTPQEDQSPVANQDELEDLPVGWTKVTFQTRIPNPHYINIQKIKNDVLEELLNQVEEDKKEQAKQIMKYQVDAQYASLEAMTPPYFIDERVCYISDYKSNKQVKEEWDSLIERLDLVEDDD